MTAASPVAASTYIGGWYDQNGNGVADTWLVDDDGNFATAERMLVDNNENNYVEMQLVYDSFGRLGWVWLDAEENGSYEIMVQPSYNANGTIRGRTLWFDPDLDGRFHVAYYDGDMDGYYEWVCVDTNYDGLCDRWIGNAAPRGRTATDQIARNASYNNWVNGMHARGLAVFFPTVTVPLP